MASSPSGALRPDIDSPEMRKAGPELLSLALMDARNHTLHLLGMADSAGATPEDARGLWWAAGHIAWFAEYFIGRNTQRSRGRLCPPDATRLASVEPHADRWWDPRQAPAALRAGLDLPEPAAVRAFMLDTLESTLELLERAAPDPDSLYAWHLALFHEDLRGEQLLVKAQTLGLKLQVDGPAGAMPRDGLLVPATRWALGSADSEGFCPDNERAQHRVELPEFEIDAQPVLWAQYLEFVDDGGYDNASLWHPQGWDWLQAGARRAPRHVEQISVASGAVLQTRFGRPTRMAGHHPVMHVSWWEADAWCRWAGRRLPLEVEWEAAAHQAARRGFAWGQVWEWTANTLYAYPGFEPGPWAAYSAPHFGAARVLRGASFATRLRMKHPKFRGFARPGWDEGFTGFRSCSLL